MTRRTPPPMHYDGHLWWYTERFDPAEDRCCVCRELIPEEEVPLILFKTVGTATWQTRLHWEPCANGLLVRGILQLGRR
jgi:hypothetical protein